MGGVRLVILPQVRSPVKIPTQPSRIPPPLTIPKPPLKIVNLTKRPLTRKPPRKEKKEHQLKENYRIPTLKIVLLVKDPIQIPRPLMKTNLQRKATTTPLKRMKMSSLPQIQSRNSPKPKHRQLQRIPKHQKIHRQANKSLPR
jgi:hypothetical protein